MTKGVLHANKMFYLCFVFGEAGGKAHLAGALLVKHVVSDIALVAQAPLAVMKGDMHGVEVENIASDSAAQGDFRVTGGDGTAEFHFQLGGDTGGLQAAREHPVGKFVDERADDAAMQGFYPAVIVHTR